MKYLFGIFLGLTLFGIFAPWCSSVAVELESGAVPESSRFDKLIRSEPQFCVEIAAKVLSNAHLQSKGFIIAGFLPGWRALLRLHQLQSLPCLETAMPYRAFRGSHGMWRSSWLPSGDPPRCGCWRPAPIEW